MTIIIMHDCEDCKHYQENEPCEATGQPVDPEQLVGDCNLFEYKQEKGI
jgi:hypothetical protein